MKRKTNAELQAQVEKLTESAALLEQENTRLRVDVRSAKHDQEKAESASAHYKAQRDTLLGYVQGTRTDRETPIEVQPDLYGAPVTINQTDRFLEDMKHDVDGGR